MPGSVTDHIRVATWNLWWRFGDPDARRPAITSELARLSPDLIGLQEVWHDAQSSLADELGAELGYQVFFAPAVGPEEWDAGLDGPHWGVGNAILARWAIEDRQVLRLPSGLAPAEDRLAMSGLVDTGHGTLRFSTTHLNSSWGHSDVRAEQLAAVMGWREGLGSSQLPLVLTGDFNAGPGSDEVRRLNGESAPYPGAPEVFDAWRYVRGTEPGYTWDRSNPHVAGPEPSYRIDYVFTGRHRDDGRGRPVAARLFGADPIDGVVPSDHYGVVVDLAV